MSDTVELERLINCTQATIRRFPWSTEYNASMIGEFNRTEILDVLGEMITRGKSHVPKEMEAVTLREFITECLFPTTKSPYELPWQLKTAWGVVFGAMLLVAITGNSIVLWIVLAHRRMRTVTNYFLLNLSVADLLMSSLNCSFNFIFMLNSDWPFGAVYCTINNFMANMSVASSVFTLVAISLDRFPRGHPVSNSVMQWKGSKVYSEGSSVLPSAAFHGATHSVYPATRAAVNSYSWKR